MLQRTKDVVALVHIRPSQASDIAPVGLWVTSSRCRIPSLNAAILDDHRSLPREPEFWRKAMASEWSRVLCQDVMSQRFQRSTSKSGSKIPGLESQSRRGHRLLRTNSRKRSSEDLPASGFSIDRATEIQAQRAAAVRCGTQIKPTTGRTV